MGKLRNRWAEAQLTEAFEGAASRPVQDAES
jgi:hypothetical protein